MLDFYVCLMFIGSFFKSAPKSQSVSSPSGIATAPWVHCVPMIGVLQPSSSLPLLLLFLATLSQYLATLEAAVECVVE